MTGKLVEAVTDFTHAIQLDPKCVDAYRRRGQSLMAINELRLSLSDFNAGVALEPQVIVVLLS
jgi:hypothetical protein